MSTPLVKNMYTVYYLPLEAEFYVPPTREHIMKNGTRIEMNSSTINKLFKSLSLLEGSVPQKGDYARLRILIVNNSIGDKLLITADKRIISNNMIYEIDIQVVETVLKEIINLIEKRT